MRIYQGNGLGDFYYKLIRDITKHGREIVIRGRRCMELTEPVTLVYNKPGYCWMNIPGRKFNPFFALAEVAWILMGNGSAEWIGYFNSRMMTFLDEGHSELHGAYGVRLRRISRYEGGKWVEPMDQIHEVVEKLRRDPTTRQAVMTLWDPVQDNSPSKDIPCNNVVYYSLRDGVLDQTVVIRSNDIVWGTPYNAIQFSHLQALVAGEVGAEIGTLTYVIQNLHYYFDEYKMTLATLLEQAHDEESEIKALSIPGFCPTTDAELQALDSTLDMIKLNYRGPDVYNVDPRLHFGNGYWNQVIPQMIWIFTAIKEKTVPADKIFDRITMLGEPLIPLIFDFYRGSENVLVQEIWNAYYSIPR